MNLVDSITFRKAEIDLENLDLSKLSMDEGKEPKTDFEVAYSIFKESETNNAGEGCSQPPEQNIKNFFIEGFQDDSMQMITLYDKVIGCFCIIEEEKIVALQRMYIQPKFRGEGIGQKLMGLALEKAHKVKKPLEIEVLVNNTHAIKVYNKYGFKKFSEFSVKTVQVIIMRHKDTEKYIPKPKNCG